MSQKVFRDCLGLKRIIRNTKGRLANLKLGLRGGWVVVVTLHMPHLVFIVNGSLIIGLSKITFENYPFLS